MKDTIQVDGTLFRRFYQEGGRGRQQRSRVRVRRKLIQLAHKNSVAQFNTFVRLSGAEADKEKQGFIQLTPDERGLKMADVLLEVEVEGIKEAILATTTAQQWMELPHLYRHMFPVIANSHLRILLEKAAAKANKELYDAIKM